MRHLTRLLLSAVLCCACLATQTGCPAMFQPPAAGAAQPGSRSLRAEASAVNVTCQVAVDGINRAFDAGLISEDAYLALGQPIGVVEAGRQELTRIAAAGEDDRWAAQLATVNAALAELAKGQRAANATADRIVAKKQSPSAKSAAHSKTPATKAPAKKPATRPAAAKPPSPTPKGTP